MRILIIHNHYQQAGGEDQVVRHEMELLKNNGHYVKLLTFDNEQLSKSIFQLIYNKQTYAHTLNTIHDFKPDIVHVHNIFYQATASVFYAIKSVNLPVVVTFHNYRAICNNALLMRNGSTCELCVNRFFPIDGIKHGCFQDSALKSVMLTTITTWQKQQAVWSKLVDRIIVLTNFAKQKFAKSSLKISEKQLIVKPNSTGKYERLSLSKRNNDFLFIGRLSEEKGITTLLKAAKYTDAVIFIIGDGPLQHEVREITRKFSNVNYLGKLTHNQVINHLQKTKALILPSQCYEGLPNTLIEAFATATPVIISDIDNLNQLVEHEHNGLHFRTGDAKSLSNQIKRLANDNELWKLLSNKAYETYSQQYTDEHNYQQLIAIYQKLTHGTSSTN